MTPVPVVSATLTTRTVRECRNLDQNEGAWQACVGHSVGYLANYHEIRERLTVDPVFVVLPEAPDLTCRRCGGLGRSGTLDPDANFAGMRDCESCRGFGISPVYGCTRQCRWDFGGYVPPEGHWAAGTTEWAYRPQCSVDPGPSSYQGAIHERRQVVEWRATDVTVLPVVDQDDPIACLDFGDDRTHLLVVIGDDDLWDVTDEPWAADLEVGQFVLRLDGWEHLEQPHTEMVCPRCEGVGWIGPGMNAPICPDCGPKVWVPLSVPDGVLSWIELA